MEKTRKSANLHGRDRLLQLGQDVVKASDADITEVVIMTEDSLLTRYANSTVHQNVTVRNLAIGVRLRYGNKVGVSWINSTDRDSIKSLISSAKDIATQSPEQELPQPVSSCDARPVDWAFDPETADVPPDYLGEKVGQALAAIKPFAGFGSFSKGVMELALVNSRGLEAYHAMTDAHFAINPMKDMASSWAQASSVKISDIDPVALAERAGQRARATMHPTSLEPGEYTVILEPLAVGEIFDFANWLGFSARAYQEGRSFLVGKMGKQVFSPEITLVEDPNQGFPYPFDTEGVARKAFDLIEKGVPVNLLHDLKTASKDSVRSTGNAAMPFGNYPYAMNMVLKPGTKTPEQLISETERGVLITRLWYTNVAEPMSFTLTGMTRDGLFLIEDGKITKALKNMRFTQNMLEALSEAEVASDSTLVGEITWYSFHMPWGAVFPSMKLKRFNFTSGTEF